MYPIKYFFCFLVFSACVFQSCSLEKRHYTSGYHLQWKKNKSDLIPQHTKATLAEVKKQINDRVSSKETEGISSLSFNLLTVSSERKKGIVLLTVDSTRCDTIIMRDGTERNAKVIEITPAEIKYKDCNNINGPAYVVYRYKVSYIKYPNGTVDSFVNEYPPSQTITKNKTEANPDIGNYVRRRSIASLVLGIISILIPIIGFFTSFFAIGFAIECLTLIRKNRESLWRYSTSSIIGLVLGIIALLVYIAFIVALIVGF